ncbi:hypothetical protein AMECASPLE_009801 [Ameca splendens]|uniref:Secreted protein n=1 Tax=Ameca splendens TaxID=208324 RepID=A0ABV0YBG4_9TELE
MVCMCVWFVMLIVAGGSFNCQSGKSERKMIPVSNCIVTVSDVAGISRMSLLSPLRRFLHDTHMNVHEASLRRHDSKNSTNYSTKQHQTAPRTPATSVIPLREQNGRATDKQTVHIFIKKQCLCYGP